MNLYLRISRGISAIAFMAAVVLIPCSRANAAAVSGPNILFILIDDLGWADLGCYGNTFTESPHIDRLATQGMRFTDAYAACPVCSPTRASLMTGKYPATVDITDFIPGHWRPFARLEVPKFRRQLPLEETTLAEPLQAAGYATGYLGKWHLGGESHYPHRQGFDEVIVSSGGRHHGPRWWSNTGATPKADDYLTDRLTDEAIGFMTRHRKKPFLLYLSHYAVHIPLQAKRTAIEKYEAKAMRQPTPVHPTYAAMIEHVDQSVGRLMQSLDRLGLTKNTVVVFFSDNGGLTRTYTGRGQAVTVNLPLRDEKGTVYDGGIRVPLLVRWPGVVKPGSTCDVPVSSVDMFPTFMQVAGMSEKTPRDVDGASLVPLLKETGRWRREAIYWHYPHYHHMSPAGAIRSGDFKLIERFEDGGLELYNLKEDIGEKNNLAKTMPDTARRLQERLAAWRQRVGAKMPTKNPNYDPRRAAEWGKRSKRAAGVKPSGR